MTTQDNAINMIAVKEVQSCTCSGCSRLTKILLRSFSERNFTGGYFWEKLGDKTNSSTAENLFRQTWMTWRRKGKLALSAVASRNSILMAPFVKMRGCEAFQCYSCVVGRLCSTVVSSFYIKVLRLTKTVLGIIIMTTPSVPSALKAETCLGNL